MLCSGCVCHVGLSKTAAPVFIAKPKVLEFCWIWSLMYFKLPHPSRHAALAPLQAWLGLANSWELLGLCVSTPADVHWFLSDNVLMANLFYKSCTFGVCQWFVYTECNYPLKPFFSLDLVFKSSESWAQRLHLHFCSSSLT